MFLNDLKSDSSFLGQRSKFSKTITSNEKLSLVLRVSPSQASQIRQLINIHSAERKLNEPTTEHLQANKRARTEKSREEIINKSEDERSTATNATNNTSNNNNEDERSEVSQTRNNATTNGNRQSSDRLNWEYVRRLKPNVSFLEEFRVDFPYLEKNFNSFLPHFYWHYYI